MSPETILAYQKVDHRTDEPVPPSFEAIVLACLAKEPDRRPATAGHLRARLWADGTFRKWNTDRARRWWREHGAELKERPTVTEDLARTLAIDLRKRKR